MTGRVLVVGAGVAGMATAIRLRQAGWEPTIVEKAAARRTGGYFLVMFPEGKAAAKRLNIFEHLHIRTPRGTRTWDIDGAGNRTRSAGFVDQPERPDALLRGDVEDALWAGLGDIPVQFGVTPVAIHEHPDGVDVRLRDLATDEVRDERFDLVIGADGLRSTVRRLVFGEHERFLKPMNAIICAFQFDEQAPYVAPIDGLVLAEPRRSLWVFPFEDRPPTALFTYRTDDVDSQFMRPSREVIREVYADLTHSSDVVRHALDQLDNAREPLFDSVHQVDMPAWHTRRVVLMGDAGWCLTLYTGMGASTAMLGACVLGHMIEQHPDDLAGALGAWDKGMRPFVRKQQLRAHLAGQFFVPSNGLLAFVRNQMSRRAGRKQIRKEADTATATSLS